MGKALMVLMGVFLLVLLYFVIMLPKPLFQDPLSSVVNDKHGQLLSARIADDGQWRFPSADSVNSKFKQCIIAYEDRRFYYHPGVDLYAIGRAVKSNLLTGRKQGASTLTMQVARMHRGNQSRSLFHKLVETVEALAIECRYSKEEILNLYASHAPFGGNVVGIEAASWRYYNRSQHTLSWAENATLAVLPNSPSLIHVSRNRESLRRKRDLLLTMLRDKGVLSEEECLLACEEPLPDKLYSLPNDAPHLIDFMTQHANSTQLTCLDARIQRRVQQVANEYSRRYRTANRIDNIAVLVLDVQSGYPVAYVGNTTEPGVEASYVDVIQAERSPGSLLKPFLYGAMVSCGEITPRQLIADTPLNINGFVPSNYSHTFCGAVHADEAIMRSLNVPLVRMLAEHGVGRFMDDLKWLGMTTLHYDEDHYGVSLILGGAEAKLWDLCQMYRGLANRLNKGVSSAAEGDRLSLSGIWSAFEAMSQLNRPEEEADWQYFKSMKKVAWKTGTSWGSRDAWAIGVTPRYVVGVWCGNATGEGRSGMTGVGFAAPVMFDVYSMFDDCGWFTQPLSTLQPTAICRQSGRLASALCAEVDTTMVPKESQQTMVCDYCKKVHLSNDERWQVNSTCMDVSQMKTISRFILPPAQEFYYRANHLEYQLLPPFHPDCAGSATEQLDFIYPEHNDIIVLPRGFSGEKQNVVFTAVARRTATLYWHLDDQYLGETTDKHQMACIPSEGQHTLSVVDANGNRRAITIFVK